MNWPPSNIKLLVKRGVPVSRKDKETLAKVCALRGGALRWPLVATKWSRKKREKRLIWTGGERRKKDGGGK